jgi:PAS domain-containing protein
VKSALLFSDAVRSLPDATFVASSDGLVLDANPAALNTIGLSSIESNLELALLRSPAPGKLVWRTPGGPKPIINRVVRTAGEPVPARAGDSAV